MAAETSSDVSPKSVQDWSISESLRGVKLPLGEHYIIAQVLDLGFTVAWTVNSTAAETIAKLNLNAAFSAKAIEATPNGDRKSEKISGSSIVEFLGRNSCWWVKISHPDMDDYLVYIDGPDGEPGEVALMGAPLDERAKSLPDHRIAHLRSVMECTAAPEVAAELPWMFDRLVETIRYSADAASL